MDKKYIRLWFRTDGSWFYEQYLTSDPNWKEAFCLMRSEGASVRIEYVDKNNLLHIEKKVSSFLQDQEDTEHGSESPAVPV